MLLQIPSVLPFSQNNRIRISTDTIRLSADSLIVPVDRIRKSADRIRKPTSRQNHFSSTKNPKIHKKAPFSKKSSRFQFLWNKKRLFPHKFSSIFAHALIFSSPNSTSFYQFFLTITPSQNKRQQSTPPHGGDGGGSYLLTASLLKTYRRKEALQCAYGCGEECARGRREDFGDHQSGHI